MTTVNFKTTTEDAALIHRIAMRAHAEYRADPLSTEMDITAVHVNCWPLDLDRLLNAHDLNFVHDVAGIARHLDRETGHLMDNFVPRFAKPKEATS